MRGSPADTHGKIQNMSPRSHLPRPSSAPARTGFAYESGLGWPTPGLWRWPPDTHLATALALALPVWVLLGLTMGQAMYLPATVWAWASLALVQPLLEELVFRGILQGQALRLTVRRGALIRLGPVTLANVLVTLAFVALHLRSQPLYWALAVAGPSLVSGHVRERFDSVWPAVLLHAVYNGGFGVTAWLVRAT